MKYMNKIHFLLIILILSIISTSSAQLSNCFTSSQVLEIQNTSLVNIFEQLCNLQQQTVNNITNIKINIEEINDNTYTKSESDLWRNFTTEKIRADLILNTMNLTNTYNVYNTTLHDNFYQYNNELRDTFNNSESSLASNAREYFNQFMTNYTDDFERRYQTAAQLGIMTDLLNQSREFNRWKTTAYAEFSDQIDIIKQDTEKYKTDISEGFDKKIEEMSSQFITYQDLYSKNITLPKITQETQERTKFSIKDIIIWIILALIIIGVVYEKYGKQRINMATEKISPISKVAGLKYGKQKLLEKAKDNETNIKDKRFEPPKLKERIEFIKKKRKTGISEIDQE